MNLGLITAIVVGLLLVGGVAVMALSSNDSSAPTVTKTCGSGS